MGAARLHGIVYQTGTDRIVRKLLGHPAPEPRQEWTSERVLGLAFEPNVVLVRGVPTTVPERTRAV